MKKYIFLTILTSIFLVFSYGQKPTLELTFTAVNEGQYVPIDSIFIENLTQGGDTILNAPDTTLILDYITSIGDNTYQKSKFSVSQNYPNPYNGKTTIELYLPEDEYVIITVQNIVGRELVQYSNTLRRGSHSFEFHSGNEKIYLFTATGKSDKETIKMISGISSSIFNSQCNLVYNGHTSQVISLKIQNSLSNFVFNLGDQLRYTGYAQTLSAINGSDTIVDIPMTNEMYEFNISAINLEIPTVTTDSATFITQSSATSGGDVTSDGGAAVTARGVCWSISSNPTLADDYTIDGSGLGTFVSNITGLSPNTTYYVRAYATNSIGTAYGNEILFTTLVEPVLPTVTTDTATNITPNSATSGGNVLSDGGAFVTARGVCWSTSSNPTLADNHTVDGYGTGPFISNLTGLSENTTYYVRAYATNSVGTAYGNEIIFTTLLNLVIPVVTTDTASNITQTTATSGGEVISDGGSPVTARGVCWSTSSNPTLADDYTIDGSGLGSFVSSITGLTSNTTYYVRAYATNTVGTAYGDELSFTTLPPVLPIVTTDSVSAITDTTATCGGEVSDDGGAAVTARGVCWSTSSNPTLADNFTVDGSGLGVFVSNLTGLTPNTNYFVRAYATNSVGTAYGNEFDFMTLWTHCPGIPTITYEGQIYNTVLIGTQCWLKENLNVGSMIPGSQDMMDNSLIEKYCYNDEIDSCDVYGGLYQWNEVMQYTTTPGVQGICPPGWHIPTDEEWKQLEGEVDSQYGYPDPEWDNIEFRGFDAGKNLKTTSGWFNNGNGTDDYGFSALPGGYRYYAGNFYNLGKTATFWSATEFNSSRVWARGLGYGNDEAGRSYYSKGYGFSLRCLKD